MTWNPADVDYLTLIGNIIITVLHVYIQEKSYYEETVNRKVNLKIL